MGREMLQMLPHFGYPVELEDISKNIVVDKFKETFGKTSLMDGFNQLYWNDKDYTNFLKKTLSGSIIRREYDDYVNYLSIDCIPQAVAWTGEMALMHMKLLEGNRKTQEGNVAQRGGKELLG